MGLWGVQIMQIKFKKQDTEGITRIESRGEIKEVLINEDLMHPEKEGISLCFRGKTSSGIVELSTKEVDMIAKAAKSNLHLIKDMKKVRI